jgi:hypothetical protein
MEWWNVGKSEEWKIDDLVKSLKRRISVIPAKAGIQLFQTFKKILWTPVSTGVTTFYGSIKIGRLENWRVGRLEYIKDEMLEDQFLIHYHYSIIPFFQYSSGFVQREDF